ncbi:Mitochondrial arginine transporter BAC2 [Platanthera zijinensis]|uniref:Mitochondrial arginine transporter BAC2 n=1 Tax=Platanthera zijinensis TaxID=2320716 RepID=A0AAP0BA48_9ASPA
MSSIRGQAFSPKEDQALCYAWLEVSEDPVMGSNQKEQRMWERISIIFHNTRPQTCVGQRTPKSLSCRWSLLASKTSKFRGCIWQIEQRNPNDASELDISGTRPPPPPPCFFPSPALPPFHCRRRRPDRRPPAGSPDSGEHSGGCPATGGQGHHRPVAGQPPEGSPESGGSGKGGDGGAGEKTGGDSDFFLINIILHRGESRGGRAKPAPVTGSSHASPFFIPSLVVQGFAQLHPRRALLLRLPSTLHRLPQSRRCSQFRLQCSFSCMRYFMLQEELHEVKSSLFDSRVRRDHDVSCFRQIGAELRAELEKSWEELRPPPAVTLPDLLRPTLPGSSASGDPVGGIRSSHHRLYRRRWPPEDILAQKIYFWTYESAGEHMHPGRRKRGGESLGTMLVVGGLAEVACWVLCYPLDVLKSSI